jgi:hypothetical protein
MGNPLRTLATLDLKTGCRLRLYRNYAATEFKYIIYCNRGKHLFPINELFTTAKAAFKVFREYQNNPNI